MLLKGSRSRTYKLGTWSANGIPGGHSCCSYPEWRVQKNQHVGAIHQMSQTWKTLPLNPASCKRTESTFVNIEVFKSQQNMVKMVPQQLMCHIMWRYKVDVNIIHRQHMQVTIHWTMNWISCLAYQNRIHNGSCSAPQEFQDWHNTQHRVQKG